MCENRSFNEWIVLLQKGNVYADSANNTRFAKPKEVVSLHIIQALNYYFSQRVLDQGPELYILVKQAIEHMQTICGNKHMKEALEYAQLVVTQAHSILLRQRGMLQYLKRMGAYYSSQKKTSISLPDSFALTLVHLQNELGENAVSKAHDMWFAQSITDTTWGEKKKKT